MRKPLSRRTVLRGALGTTIALPWLESMSAAQPTTPPKRFIAFLHNNGRVAEDWFPSAGGETDFALGPIMKALEPHRKDLLILRGIDNKAASRGPLDSHRRGVASFLTGWGTQTTKAADGSLSGGMSIDQKIGKLAPVTVSRPVLHLGTQGGGSINDLSYDAAKQAVPKSTFPAGLFKTLFGTGAAPDMAAIKKLLQKRKSILDSVSDSYTGLRGSVSADDVRRIDAHLAAIREVEARLVPTSTCGQPNAAGFPNGDNLEKLPECIRSMLDLAILALSCDMTRAVTMSFRNPGGGSSYHRWLGIAGDGKVGEHHEMSHADKNYREQLKIVSAWYVQETTAYVATRLKALNEGGQSIFANSLILQGSEIASGPAHSLLDMPYLLVGSAGGALKTGRYLQFDHASHNDLLVSILNAFGVPDKTWGDPAVCTGPLPGLLA
jgi:hypothetical protein